MSALVAKAVAAAKNLAVAAGPQLTIAARYAKVELVPPKLSELPAVRSGLGKLLHSAKTGRFREITVKDAWLNTLVGIEIWCWFFIGECIGKRSFIGYNV